MKYTNWQQFSYKDLYTFDYKAGRNLIGAKPDQMPYLVRANKSRDKTTKKYKPEISKFFLDQSDRIMQRYNEFFNIKSDIIFPVDQVEAVIEFILPPSEIGLMKETYRPMQTSGVQKAVEDINELADVAVDASLTNATVLSRLNNLAERVVMVDKSTKYMIRQNILNGISDGRGVLEIAQDIRKLGINEYYEGRALAIARTETRVAYDAGGSIASKELGASKFDVVGCVGTLAGVNELGLSASYGDFSETIGSCGVLGVEIALWDSVSSIHHPNHGGTMIATL
jgi:hypothetical protein